MNFTRYGVYFTPRPGGFANSGATWLGWDLATGDHVDTAEGPATKRPRKYGFHGTIKPPFFLAKGHDVDALKAACATLCAQLVPVTLDGLEITKIGSFLALTPRGDMSALADMAGQVVRDLDEFRAPPSSEETARRRKSSLTALQAENLVRWGYPYVMAAFKFHMTLTGPLPRDQVDAVQRRATAHFAGTLPAPFVLDCLTLVGEDSEGQFHALNRFDLQAAGV